MTTPSEFLCGSALEQGPPIPPPLYLDAAATRLEVINCALEDCRGLESVANRVRVAVWIEAYLNFWQSLQHSPDHGTQT